MKLDGIHHVTCITGDAPRNVDFYTRVLGLRLVKKSVNQDDPTVYHLFYADEAGDPGSDITFFEYPGAIPGRAGPGMVHLIRWRIASDDALSFWAERLGRENVESFRDAATLRFADPGGLTPEPVVFARSGGPHARARWRRAAGRAAGRLAPGRAERARAAGIRRRARLRAR